MAKTIHAKTIAVQSLDCKYGKIVVPPYEVDIEFTPQEQQVLDSGINADMIPNTADANNQLADKQYVNQQVATSSASFQGSYNLVTDLHLSISATQSDIVTALVSAITGAGTSDYCYVQIPIADTAPTQLDHEERYKFNGPSWGYEFSVNSSPEGYVFDVSAYNNNTKYSDLSAALAAIPDSVKKGGMNVKFIQSSDNKYVQYRYMSDDATTVATFTNSANWQGVDDEPTAGSDNLVKSGGVKDAINDVVNDYLPFTEIAVKNPVYIDGKKVTTAGSIEDASGIGYIAPIELHPHDTIILHMGENYYIPGNTAGIYKTDSSGNFVSLINGTAYYNAPLSYTNDSNNTIYIGLCSYPGYLPYIMRNFVRAASGVVTTEVDELNKEINGIKHILNVTAGTSHQYGDDMLNISFTAGSKVFFALNNGTGSYNDANSAVIRFYNGSNQQIGSDVIINKEGKYIEIPQGAVKIGIYINGSSITSSGTLVLSIIDDSMVKGQLMNTERTIETINNRTEGTVNILNIVSGSSHAYGSDMLDIAISQGTYFKISIKEGTGQWGGNNTAIKFKYSDNTEKDTLIKNGEDVETIAEKNITQIQVYIGSDNVLSTGTLIMTVLQKLSYVTERVDKLQQSTGTMMGWFGKTIGLLGDSITALCGNETVTPHSWAWYMQQNMMCNFVPRGFGSTFTCHHYVPDVQKGQAPAGESIWTEFDYNGNRKAVGQGDIAISYTGMCDWQRITTQFPATIKDTIDAVILMGGTNDLGSKPLGDTTFIEGSLTDPDTQDVPWGQSSLFNGGDYNINTFKGAVCSAIMKLQAWMPQAVIIIATPLSAPNKGVGASNANTNVPYIVPSGAQQGLTIESYADAAIEAARYLSIPVIDVYGECGINHFIRDHHLIDSAHPSAQNGNGITDSQGVMHYDGCKNMARVFLAGMSRIYPKIDYTPWP